MDLLCGTPPESRAPVVTCAMPWPARDTTTAWTDAPDRRVVDVAALRTATIMAQNLIEAAGGRRSLEQLSATIGPEPAATLQTWIAERTTPTRVRRVRAVRLTPDVIEAAVIVTDGSTASAVAMRLERFPGRWRCVVLERRPAASIRTNKIAS